MERAKGKWAALDGVDVCRGESERDESKGSEEERGVEIISMVGREKDVENSATSSLGISLAMHTVVRKSSHCSGNLSNKSCQAAQLF